MNQTGRPRASRYGGLTGESNEGPKTETPIFAASQNSRNSLQQRSAAT
jgi:hypothetical protein